MNKEKISVWNFSVLSSPNDFSYGVLEVNGEAFQADFLSSAVLSHLSAINLLFLPYVSALLLFVLSLCVHLLWCMVLASLMAESYHCFKTCNRIFSGKFCLESN